MTAMSNLGNNAFTLLVVAAFFYLIYLKLKGSSFHLNFDRIKGIFGRK